MKYFVVLSVSFFAVYQLGCDQKKTEPDSSFTGTGTGPDTVSKDNASTNKNASSKIGIAQQPNTKTPHSEEQFEINKNRCAKKYELVIPRFGFPTGKLFGNLIYEGNNAAIRGKPNSDGVIEAPAKEVAFRWKKAAVKTNGVFVLRDSLFSQQDHPYRQSPHSLMLPPNWVTAAIAAYETNGDIVLPVNFDVQDDSSWTSVASPQQMFGSFPISDSLYEHATQEKQNEGGDALIINARSSIVLLAKSALLLKKAASNGSERIAEQGAQIIVNSDDGYFGKGVVKRFIIPIFVENPTAKEIAEGKGMRVFDGLPISDDLVFMATTQIYKTRLSKGDIAIERYNISNKKERQRAIRLLEALIPKESKDKTQIWLWVTGTLDPLKKLKGENATAYVNDFRIELANGNINTDRVRLLSKPTVMLKADKDRKKRFHEELARYTALKLPLCITLHTKSLIRLMD